MTQVPVTFALDRAVSIVEAVGQPHLFGKGTLEDPLFPIEVQLTGQSGNCYRITGAIEKAVRTYLRRSPLEQRFAAPIAEAIRAELWDARSYEDLLLRAQCLVRAR